MKNKQKHKQLLYAMDMNKTYFDNFLARFIFVDLFVDTCGVKYSHTV